jgi:hypothetical protein
MKVNDIILEREVKPYQSKVLEINRAVELLNQHCRESLVLIKNPIWRGMIDHSAQILTIDPSTGIRRSQNTYNYYTEIMDHSPYMKGWPKRSASFVCSSSYSYASSYAYDIKRGTFALFPYDGVKIAVCPERDIWETNIVIPEFKLKFVNKNRNLSNFNYWIRRYVPDDSWQALSQAHLRPEVIKLCRENGVDPKQFLPILMKAFSPEKTGFKLLTPAQFVAEAPKNRECWIGGPMVAINNPLYERFLNAYNQQQPRESEQ